MATLKIRNVPKETQETIRLRARAAGRSRQAYLREWVIAMAARPTEEEVIASIDAALADTDRQS
jgi:plasmid stability protein